MLSNDDDDDDDGDGDDAVRYGRPPGVFEWDNFNKGTQSVLEAVVSATKKGAVTIVGELRLVNDFF